MINNRINIKNAPTACQPDPFILQHKNDFYIYATGREGVTVFKSRDMQHWDYLGYALRVEGEAEYWAPCAIYRGGKFYLYYSSLPEGEADAHEQRIKVAESNYPDRNFQFVQNVLPPFSIDPHVVDNGCGELFIYYSVNDYAAERAGTYIVLDRMTSPYSVEGRPVAVVRPTLDEEIFLKDRFRKGQHWHTIEGACYIREGNFHYVLYSGNCYMNESYYVGYAVAEGNERDLRKLNYTKYPDARTYLPLLSKNEQVEGTGHNSAIKVNGEWYIVYHARALADRSAPYDTRVAYINKLKVDKGKLAVLNR